MKIDWLCDRINEATNNKFIWGKFMAQVKYCDKCKEKISIREMPNGVWLPFNYQTDELHKCKEIKVLKKMTKQQTVENAIKEKGLLTFKDHKHNTYVVTPNIIRKGYVSAYNHFDSKMHTYTLDKMYYIKSVQLSEVEMIIKEYKEREYGLEFILINKDNKQLTRSYSRVDYNKISQVKTKQDVIARLKEIEFLINNIKEHVDMENINEYSLINLDKKINFSLDTLLSNDILNYLEEIKEDERIRNEIIAKKREDEMKQQEIVNTAIEENNRTFKIFIGVIIIILLLLLFYFLK